MGRVNARRWQCVSDAAPGTVTCCEWPLPFSDVLGPVSIVLETPEAATLDDSGDFGERVPLGL